MKLRLTLLRSPAEQGTDTRRSLQTGRLTIGRGPDNDWILQDPDRLLSKNHCVVEFKGGVYLVIDTSTNGVFLNDSGQPIGRGNTAILHDGDRLRLGDFLVGVGFVDDHTLNSSVDPFLAVLRDGEAPLLPAAGDGEDEGFPPLAATRPPMALTPIPADDDRFGEPRDRSSPDRWNDGGDSWASPPSLDAVRPEQEAMRIGAPISAVIPDDWDLDEPAAAPPPTGQPPVARPPPSALPDDWDEALPSPPAFARRTPPTAVPASPGIEASPVAVPAALARGLAGALLAVERGRQAQGAALGLAPDPADAAAAPLALALDAEDAVLRLSALDPGAVARAVRALAVGLSAHQSALLAAAREVLGQAGIGAEQLEISYRRLLPAHREALSDGGGSGLDDR